MALPLSFVLVRAGCVERQSASYGFFAEAAPVRTFSCELTQPSWSCFEPNGVAAGARRSRLVLNQSKMISLPVCVWCVLVRLFRSPCGGNNSSSRSGSSRRGFRTLVPRALGAFLLTSLSAHATDVTLTWTDNSLEELGFLIERSADGSSFAQIGSVGAKNTTYIDSDLGPGQYWYRVRAFSASQTSDYSEVVAFTVSSPPVLPPANTQSAPPSSTQGESVLYGTPIGSPSWAGLTQYESKSAFDNDPTTFFASNWSDALVYVGYDFGISQRISKVRYWPQTGQAWSMLGARICGANNADFSDAVTLATITSSPSEGEWHELSLPAGNAYRYVYFTNFYLNYGVMAELQFLGITAESVLTQPNATGTVSGSPGVNDDSTQAASKPIGDNTNIGTPTVALLNGTPISSGSWNDVPAYDATKVFDGDTSTAFSGKYTDPLVYVGLDLGAAKIIDAISFYPRSFLAERMNGGKFCGANRADLSDAVTLYTISSSPAEGTWINLTLPASATSFRYVFFTTPSYNFGDVAELEFYGR